MQTKDQERAKEAYRVVKSIVADNNMLDKKKSKFKTLALKFPSMVMQCGVLQALAYCKQRDSSDSSGVYKELNDWLPKCITDFPAGTDIVEKVAADVSLWQYQMVTREMIAFGVWLKRASATLMVDVKITD